MGAVARLLLVVVVMLPFLGRGHVEAKLSIDDYEIIGEALHATETDEWPRALRLMLTIDDPLTTKLFRWLTLVEGKGRADFDAIATFILENPDWPRIDDLQRLAEARLTDSANKELTKELFGQHRPLSTRGRIRFAEALFASGEQVEAVRQIRLAWIHGDFSAREEKRFLERHKRHLLASDHNGRLEQLLWDRDWRDAKRMLPRVSEAYGRLGKARLALQTQSPGVDRAINAVPAELADDPGLLYDRARWRRLKRKACRRQGIAARSAGAAGAAGALVVRALLSHPPFDRSAAVRRGLSPRQPAWPAERRRLCRGGVAGRLAGAALRQAPEVGVSAFRPAL